jgi:DNA-binding XRE family transcriptional regulator
MNNQELEAQTKAFLEETSHMQIIGNPENLKKKVVLQTDSIRSEVSKAVLVSRVGDLLRQARLERGLTGEQAGALAGVKRARVSQMETSGDVLQLQTLVDYAHSLDFEVQLSLIPKNGGAVLTRELV